MHGRGLRWYKEKKIQSNLHFKIFNIIAGVDVTKFQNIMDNQTEQWFIWEKNNNYISLWDPKQERQIHFKKHISRLNAMAGASAVLTEMSIKKFKTSTSMYLVLDLFCRLFFISYEMVWVFSYKCITFCSDLNKHKHTWKKIYIQKHGVSLDLRYQKTKSDFILNAFTNIRRSAAIPWIHLQKQPNIQNRMNASEWSGSGRKLPTANCISSLTTPRWKKTYFRSDSVWQKRAANGIYTYDTNRLTEMVEITKIVIKEAKLEATNLALN